MTNRAARRSSTLLEPLGPTVPPIPRWRGCGRNSGRNPLATSSLTCCAVPTAQPKASASSSTSGTVQQAFRTMRRICGAAATNSSRSPCETIGVSSPLSPHSRRVPAPVPCQQKCSTDGWCSSRSPGRSSGRTVDCGIRSALRKALSRARCSVRGGEFALSPNLSQCGQAEHSNRRRRSH